MAVRLPPQDATDRRKLKLSVALKLAAQAIEDRRCEQAAAWLLLMSEEVAWWTGMVYNGHSMTRKDDGWLLVVRASRQGRPMVAFSFGLTQSAAILGFAYQLVHDLVYWKEDQFRK